MGLAANPRGVRSLSVTIAALLLAATLAAVSRPTSERTADIAGGPSTTVARSTTSSSSSTTSSSPSTSSTAAPATTAARGPVAASDPAPADPPAQQLAVDTGPGAPSRPCGGSLPKAEGGTWRCTFSDEFGAPALDLNKWWVMTTQKTAFTGGGIVCLVEDPDNLQISGGSLKLIIREEPSWFTCPRGKTPYDTRWTSSMITTFGKWSQTYGRFEIRARLPDVKVPGVGVAFWLWPQDATRYGPWPLSGEIDFMEFYSSVPDRMIPFIHYVRAKPKQNGGSTSLSCFIDRPEDWHLYALEWTPKALTVMVDGKACLVDEWEPFLPLIHPQPFDQPFTVSITPALGSGTNQFDPATTGPFPAVTEIDYVRVWG